MVNINTKWLDSIIHRSDTTWIKKYRNKEFATANYFLNKKDSIVTQIMKDSANKIRQIVVAKYGTLRLFYGEYYPNGQLKSKYDFDKQGSFHGESISYFENGNIKSRGYFNHGLYAGKWENYTTSGKLNSVVTYNLSGEMIREIIK